MIYFYFSIFIYDYFWRKKKYLESDMALDVSGHDAVGDRWPYGNCHFISGPHTETLYLIASYFDSIDLITARVETPWSLGWIIVG